MSGLLPTNPTSKIYTAFPSKGHGARFRVLHVAMSIDEAKWMESGGTDTRCITNEPIIGPTLVGVNVRLVLPVRTPLKFIPGTGRETDISEVDLCNSFTAMWTVF